MGGHVDFSGALNPCSMSPASVGSRPLAMRGSMTSKVAESHPSTTRRGGDSAPALFARRRARRRRAAEGLLDGAAIRRPVEAHAPTAPRAHERLHVPVEAVALCADAQPSQRDTDGNASAVAPPEIEAQPPAVPARRAITVERCLQ